LLLCADRHSSSKEPEARAEGAVGAGAADEVVGFAGGVVTTTASNVVDGMEVGVGVGEVTTGGDGGVVSGTELGEAGRGRRDLVKV